MVNIYFQEFSVLHNKSQSYNVAICFSSFSDTVSSHSSHTADIFSLYVSLGVNILDIGRDSREPFLIGLLHHKAKTAGAQVVSIYRKNHIDNLDSFGSNFTIPPPNHFKHTCFAACPSLIIVLVK